MIYMFSVCSLALKALLLFSLYMREVHNLFVTFLLKHCINFQIFWVQPEILSSVFNPRSYYSTCPETQGDWTRGFGLSPDLRKVSLSR